LRAVGFVVMMAAGFVEDLNAASFVWFGDGVF
jgi:hypothetical protein